MVDLQRGDFSPRFMGRLMRYDISPQWRDAMVRVLVEIAFDKNAKPRERTAAIRELRNLDRMNQIDEHAVILESERTRIIEAARFLGISDEVEGLPAPGAARSDTLADDDSDIRNSGTQDTALEQGDSSDSEADE